VEIKTKKSFKSLIESLTEELLDEEDLDEDNGVTTTGDIDGYSTPFAFTAKKGKKKKKKISTNSTGYKVVKEGLDKQDLEVIKKLIRSVVGDIYRDIWLKRASWQKR
tara:strand:- start:601 stop:921 length:321 start_codon:yes stop_codon:yes gene_type:complete